MTKKRLGTHAKSKNYNPKGANYYKKNIEAKQNKIL